jgi:hypothetical protein
MFRAPNAPHDQLRLEAALTITRDLDLYLAVVRPDVLRPFAVAAVRLVFRRRLARLVAEVMVELGFHRTVDHRRREATKQRLRILQPLGAA